MDKIIKIYFQKGELIKRVRDKKLYQEDFGQVLQIEGISLPDGNVEVHFSLTEHNGEAPVSIGTVKDNVITVNIPDFILAKENEYRSSYEAYAWIYLTDGESGRTIRKIVFTIESRPKSTTNVPEDQKDQFLQEVRQVMAETKQIAQSVRDDADNGKFDGKQGPAGIPANSIIYNLNSDEEIIYDQVLSNINNGHNVFFKVTQGTPAGLYSSDGTLKYTFEDMSNEGYVDVSTESNEMYNIIATDLFTEGDVFILPKDYYIGGDYSNLPAIKFVHLGDYGNLKGTFSSEQFVYFDVDPDELDSVKMDTGIESAYTLSDFTNFEISETEVLLLPLTQVDEENRKITFSAMLEDGNILKVSNSNDYTWIKEVFDEYVKNTDYATESKGGVIKYSMYRGLTMMSNGLLALKEPTDAWIDDRNNGGDVQRATAVTLSKFDYTLKKALTDGQMALTDEEKLSARDLLGVTDILGDIEASLDAIIEIQNALIGGESA